MALRHIAGGKQGCWRGSSLTASASKKEKRKCGAEGILGAAGVAEGQAGAYNVPA